MIVSVCFTNFGPYHLARLRALAERLKSQGDFLLAYEMAGREHLYPWRTRRGKEPFDWITLFPDRPLEGLGAAECREAMTRALDRDQPDAVGVVGYARPESMAAARWARRNARPSVLMSESQAVDRRRSWFKAMIKRQRVALFDAALVGGARHRDYLVELGMPEDRVALGYNAVDNAYYRDQAAAWRSRPGGRSGLPEAPFFLTVCRFAPEKNLERLLAAYVRYRDAADPANRWDLVLCGDGPLAGAIAAAIEQCGHGNGIHRPGFLQADELPRWYANAAAFVLPSLSEPWGLVVNEAACSGLPLLVSERAGCAETLLTGPAGTTGATFDPLDLADMTEKLLWMSRLDEASRRRMGEKAALVVAGWGPERFAEGAVEALAMAHARDSSRKQARLAIR